MTVFRSFFIYLTNSTPTEVPMRVAPALTISSRSCLFLTPPAAFTPISFTDSFYALKQRLL